MSAAPFENAPAFCIFSTFFDETRNAYLDLDQMLPPDAAHNFKI